MYGKGEEGGKEKKSEMLSGKEEFEHARRYMRGFELNTPVQIAAQFTVARPKNCAGQELSRRQSLYMRVAYPKG